MLTVLSDTHSVDDTRLQGRTRTAVDEADLVVHAGDFYQPSVLDGFERAAGSLRAVYGNNDGPAIRDRLPAVCTVEYGGVRFVVTHRHRSGDTGLVMLAHGMVHTYELSIPIFVSIWLAEFDTLHFAGLEIGVTQATLGVVVTAGYALFGLGALPGGIVVDRIGIEDYRDLADGEEMEFEIGRGVVSFDGERDVEVQDARVRLWPDMDGPRLVDFDALFEKATVAGCFDA